MKLNVNTIRGLSPDFRTDVVDTLEMGAELKLLNQQYLPVPSGGAGVRPPAAQEGSLRFNTDSGKMEYFVSNADVLRSGWQVVTDIAEEEEGGGSAGPYVSVDAPANRVECFWDGAPANVSGNTWNSSQAHPNVSNANCVMQNSPTWNASITGGDGTMGYWNFNGSSQYGYIRELNYSQGGQHGPNNNGQLAEFTMGTWFRTSYGSPGGNTWDSGNWSWLDWDRSEVISWNIGTTGKVQFSGYSNAGGYYDITGNTSCNDGNWHFGACTVSSADSLIRFYVDGQPDGQHSHSFSYFGARTRRWGFIGDGSEAGSENSSRNNVYYEGDIAQQFLLSVKWTDAQVLAHFDQTKSRVGIT